MNRFKTIVAGFGQIAGGYATDPVYACAFTYGTHAQILRDQNAFDWIGVVDPDPGRAEAAKSIWNVDTVVDDAAEFPDPTSVDVVVLSTPPDVRLDVLECFPNVKAAIVEKPLGTGVASAGQFLEYCDTRGILVQVNLPRRGDPSMRALAEHGLQSACGPISAGFGLYGNGLSNNGTHMIDLVRMLLGEIIEVEALTCHSTLRQGPIPGDDSPAFSLVTESNVVVTFHPVPFGEVRENALDLWGATGRLQILNEGMIVSTSPRQNNRIVSHPDEIAGDAFHSTPTSLGVAMRELYDNLGESITKGTSLFSPGRNALATAEIVDAIRRSATQDGCVLRVT